jgi:hypothetical protein
MGRICRVATMVGLLGTGMHCARAQAIAEAGMVHSNSAAAAQSAKTPALTMASPAGQSSSPHLDARTGPPADELNRKDFEDNAGEGAGRLLLRSTPNGAEIFINDLVVGHTPMLIVLAPGKYKIDMRGSRQDSGHVTAGVMPKETQTVLVTLEQRYPARVSTH